MNEYKSISEIAAELSVTRQAVYQKIKKDKELSTGLRKFTVNENNKTLYSLQGQELIKQAFNSVASVNSKQAVDSKRVSIDSKLIDTLQATIETLTNQLQVKDKQINTLTETVKELTIALKAAQALHGMDKQQNVIETKVKQAEPRPSGAATRQETKKQERPQKTKLSFMDKLRAAADIFRK